MTNFTQLNNDLSLGRLGKPNGFASLNSAGKLDTTQIPSGIQAGLKFKGLWDAATNTPDLTSFTPTNGDLYIVSVEGTQDLNGNGPEPYTIKDSVFWSEAEGVWYHQQGSISATEVNYNNTNTDLTSTQTQGAIDELADKISQAFSINRETITADKTLVANDDIYQHIISNTSNLTVNLPASPSKDTHFVIKNSASSSESFIVNSIVLPPGSIYEVIFDGVEWAEL